MLRPTLGKDDDWSILYSSVRGGSGKTRMVVTGRRRGSVLGPGVRFRECQPPGLQLFPRPLSHPTCTLSRRLRLPVHSSKEIQGQEPVLPSRVVVLSCGLVVEPHGSHLLGRHSAAELQPRPRDLCRTSRPTPCWRFPSGAWRSLPVCTRLGRGEASSASGAQQGHV